MDERRAIDRVLAALPSLPACQRHTLTQFLHGSNITFSYVSEPRHRDAYRLFCQLISSGETANPFAKRHAALLTMMQSENSFEEFRELVSVMIRREEGSFTVIGKLAAKESFRRMFRHLLHDGWLLPREDDEQTRELMRMLHAEFAYQEGHGPKPVCVFEGQEREEFAALLEDERTFHSLSLDGPISNDVDRVEDFFAEHPSGTWKQASEALGMPIHRVKRLRKKAAGGTATASGSVAAGSSADGEHRQTRELKTSMSAAALRQTAYTQIFFADGAAIFTFEPTLRGHALWLEWVESHPFPGSPMVMDAVLRSKWDQFAESDAYRAHGPETVLGRLLRGDRGVRLFSQAEARGLYSHSLQRDLYELACPWYDGGRESVRAAQRIKDIGLELYEMGEDAIACQDDSTDGMAAILSVYAHVYENTGRLPDGLSAEQFANARRLHGLGHAAMTLHFIGLGLLTGIFDEVTKSMVPAARHSLPATRGGIVKMHHTKNLRGELEITGWQCVVEMLWDGIGQWAN